MALKDLSVQTMVTISSAWLDPERDRPLLEALPRVTALVPDIEKAHAGLVTTQKQDSTATAQLTALQEKEAEVDLLHDRKAHGTHHVLTGFAELADDSDDAAEFLALRDRLMPEGLRVTTRSYTDQAGEVELVEGRLLPSDKALLKQLPTPKGDLRKAVDGWFKAGRQLGQLEAERRELQRKIDAGEGGGATAGDVLRARNGWIRVVRGVLAMLDLEKIEDDTLEKIVGPLRQAEQKAERRGGKAKAAEEPEKGASPAGQPP
jgi:hypothetical protein